MKIQVLDLKKQMIGKISRVLVIALLSVFYSQTYAQNTPVLPFNSDDIHLGVTNCAGSTCHGATVEYDNAAVLQNEFRTWHEKDAHAQAYKVLLNEESQRIAKNLGLESAHTADICLDCHADNVSEELRGKRFDIADGVGCEACHGGAKRYLGGHISGNTHEENVAEGLYPTEEPVARARLCLSCHFGNQDKFVTHRIMGAGHPRMSFELDTFTEIQPAHYAVDEDYAERKRLWNGTQTWAIGQVLASKQIIESLLDTERQKGSGLFPELVLFDCHACHHSMDDVRWNPRATTGLGPGVVRLNDSNFLMSLQIASVIDSGIAGELKNNIRNLHQSTTVSMDATRSAAGELINTLDKLEPIVVSYNFSAEEVGKLMNGLAEQGVAGEYFDYSAAEQSVMALGAVQNTLLDMGGLDESQEKQINSVLDTLYSTLEDDNQFMPQQYIDNLRSLLNVAK